MTTFIGINGPKNAAFVTDGQTLVTSTAILLGDKGTCVAACYSPIHRAFFVSHRTPPSVRIHRNAVIAEGKPHHLICAAPEVLVSMALTPDEELFIGGGEGGSLYTWHVRSGTLVRACAAHFGAILSLAISVDGTYLATASSDSTVKVWSLLDVTCLDTPYDAQSTIRAHSIAVTNVLLFPSSPQLCLTSSKDGTLRVFDVVLEKEIWAEALPSPAVHIALALNELEVFAACQNGDVCAVSIYHHSSALPTAATISELCQGLIHSGGDDKPTGVRVIANKKHIAMSLFVPSWERLVCVTVDGTSTMWDTKSLHTVSNSGVPIPLNIGCTFRTAAAVCQQTTIGHLKKFPLTAQGDASYALPDLVTLMNTVSELKAAKKVGRKAKRGRQQPKVAEAPAPPLVEEFIAIAPRPSASVDDAQLLGLRAEADRLRSECLQLSLLERELARRRQEGV